MDQAIARRFAPRSMVSISMRHQTTGEPRSKISRVLSMLLALTKRLPALDPKRNIPPANFND